jgi:hypothetical protein
MATWRDLFISNRPVEAGKTTITVLSPKTDENATGAFVTPQSLTSFAVATSASALITRVILTLFPTSNQVLIPAIVAFLIGVIIFYINVSDKSARPKDTRSWIISIIVGLINSIYLVAVAIGVFKAIAGS